MGRNRRPTSIELFAGAGGMSLGFEQAGFNILAAFDLEKFNVTTHQKNFPSCKAFSVDLRKESGKSLLARSGLAGQEIDVVFGGPPCQGFSFGGKQDVNDERNLLVYDFARLVRQIKPKYFVMENVKGFMSPHAKPILESFVWRVKHSGYRVVEPIQVLDASHFGVPQRRQRTFILGYLAELTPPVYPEPRGFKAEDKIAFAPVVRDAISDLPTLEKIPELFDQDYLDAALPPTSSIYAGVMRGDIKDPQNKSLRKQTKIRRLTGCLRTKHSKITERRFKSTPQGSAEPVSRYIRLDWDDVSPTIRAGTGRDRGSHTAPRPIHPSLPRCITVREAARLHSFPDWFEFHNTRWHAFRQVGNSVPPLLARCVADAIIQALRA